MANNMSEDTRIKILGIAASHCFYPILKEDHTDRFDKYLLFRSRNYGSPVYINRRIGFSGTSGEFNYLKVAVHPDYFLPVLIDGTDGINDYLNQRTKINLHASSNFLDFPTFTGANEPCGKCYKVEGFEALGKLFAGLRSV